MELTKDRVPFISIMNAIKNRESNFEIMKLCIDSSNTSVLKKIINDDDLFENTGYTNEEIVYDLKNIRKNFDMKYASDIGKNVKLSKSLFISNFKRKVDKGISINATKVLLYDILHNYDDSLFVEAERHGLFHNIKVYEDDNKFEVIEHSWTYPKLTEEEMYKIFNIKDKWVLSAYPSYTFSSFDLSTAKQNSIENLITFNILFITALTVIHDEFSLMTDGITIKDMGETIINSWIFQGILLDTFPTSSVYKVLNYSDELNILYEYFENYTNKRGDIKSIIISYCKYRHDVILSDRYIETLLGICDTFLI